MVNTTTTTRSTFQSTLPDEYTPLIDVVGTSLIHSSSYIDDDNLRQQQRRRAIYDFLEARTASGRIYEIFMFVLILLNVLCFIVGSLFVEEYNDASWAKRSVNDGGICNNVCDAVWFGNYRDNGLQILNIGATSILEIFTITVFTIEYSVRLYTCDLEDPKYKGWKGRFKYIPTFFSMIDLVSTIPFYIDAFLLTNSDLASSAFLRMFRLFRMMRVEGRYDSALTLVDDVYRAQKAILGTALFVGMTTWITVSSLYYLVERKNYDMIYCGAAPDYCGDPDEIDTSLCVIDSWGLVDCSDASCPASADAPEPCYNLFQSIPMASYYSLLNLFGEFPLVDQHSPGGQVVGTITAIVAVAVFALPAGIIGNGFEEQIEKRRTQEVNDGPIIERGLRTSRFVANNDDDNDTGTFLHHTFRPYLYNFFFAMTAPGSGTYEMFINTLIVGTSVTFMVDTIDELPEWYRIWQSWFEFVAVLVFSLEYVLKVYAITADPMYRNGNIWPYMSSFLPMVDLLSFFPYWIVLAITGTVVDTTGPSDMGATFVKALRLLRIFRFEKYTHAFTSFDDVISRNLDVLSVTVFSALLLWVFFGAFLYYTERDNPDDEMASNYSTIPNAMWMTLLNLSGEAPLCQYSVPGKVATGLLGLFATAVFGIPIGILGAGFEEVIGDENQDDHRELVATSSGDTRLVGTALERWCYDLVNGFGSALARAVETGIYVLIFTAILIGIIQTVEGHENDFSNVESFAVYMFTLEYAIRFIGAGADPNYRIHGSGFISRMHYVVSFYSLIDLLAIVPYYVALALPGSLVDQYDEYLRMSRILRLVSPVSVSMKNFCLNSTSISIVLDVTTLV
jgi:hypothetical protein